MWELRGGPEGGPEGWREEEGGFPCRKSLNLSNPGLLRSVVANFIVVSTYISYIIFIVTSKKTCIIVFVALWVVFGLSLV